MSQTAMSETANQLDALGNSTRRAVFELLAQKPRSVGEIADALPVSRPAVSQHLRVLKDARLVRDRVDGTRRIYSIDSSGIDALRNYVDRLWDSALADFESAAQLEKGNE